MFGWRDNIHTNRPHVIVMRFYYNGGGGVSKIYPTEQKCTNKKF